ERLQRPREIVGRALAHERAAAGARLDDPEELERAQRLADGRARYLELLGEGALGRELIARVELAFLEERLDLLDDALVQPASADRLDRRQVPASRLGVLVRWSDQTEREPKTASAGPSRGPLTGHEQPEPLLSRLGGVQG